MINDDFNIFEELYRTVYPPSYRELYWKSAAFYDPKGLSVDRKGNRTEKEAVSRMLRFFLGYIVSVRVKDCIDIDALIVSAPSKNNIVATLVA